MVASLKVLNDTKGLWHDGHLTAMLGCQACYNRRICGGLNIGVAAFSCRNFCRCTEASNCNFVCPARPASYVRYLREVGGLELSNISRTCRMPVPELPDIVPMIYGRASRRSALRLPWAAVPLAALFSRATGDAKYPDRESLLAGFLLDPATQVVVCGVDVDASLERYWREARGAGFVHRLAQLKPDLVTTPNYSLFVNAPREDNLHNMKRIAISWYELSAAGLPVALHVNARTDRDWERWTEFVADRDEVQALAFEFATGAKYADRRNWHAEKLCRLAHDVGRDLTLVVRGNRHVETLRRAFRRVSVIDTSIYVKSVHRQRIVKIEGRKRHWDRTWTLLGEPIDRVIQDNVQIATGPAQDGAVMREV